MPFLISFRCQVAIDDIIEGCRSVFSHTVQRLHCIAWSKLATLGIDDTALGDVFSEIVDPFLDLDTRHKQEKCFKEDFGLVVRNS